jgi:hypothetical protein
MRKSQPLQPDRKFDITTSNDILDLEFLELGVESQFLDDPGVFSRSKTRIILGFSSSDDHLSGSEDQGGSLGITDTHNDGSETLQVGKVK